MNCFLFICCYLLLHHEWIFPRHCGLQHIFWLILLVAEVLVLILYRKRRTKTIWYFRWKGSCPNPYSIVSSRFCIFAQQNLVGIVFLHYNPSIRGHFFWGKAVLLAKYLDMDTKRINYSLAFLGESPLSTWNSSSISSILYKKVITVKKNICKTFCHCKTRRRLLFCLFCNIGSIIYIGKSKVRDTQGKNEHI